MFLWRNKKNIRIFSFEKCALSGATILELKIASSGFLFHRKLVLKSNNEGENLNEMSDSKCKALFLEKNKNTIFILNIWTS